jgi:hypothetical protein
VAAVEIGVFFLRHPVRFDDLPVARVVEFQSEKKRPAESEVFALLSFRQRSIDGSLDGVD